MADLIRFTHLGKNIAFLLFVALFMSGCALEQLAAIQTGNRDATFATSSGFVEDFDEPSARGILKRISPENADVRRKFIISPDGKSIVYSGAQRQVKVRKYSDGSIKRVSDGSIDLWKINADGGPPIKITSGGRNDCLSPSFTKDGKYLIYESGGSIWKVKSDGSGGRLKIPGTGMGYDYAPEASPVSDKLLFATKQSTSQGVVSTIWTSNLDGSELTQIREGSYPTWSPDGKFITFAHADDIWLISADGVQLKQLTNTEKIIEGFPRFSSDGKRIVFTSNEVAELEQAVDPDFNIWSMNAEGANRMQHTQLRSWDSWPLMSDKGIYFLSGRAAAKKDSTVQQMWLIKKKL